MNNESMLKIAICDDEQPIRDYLKKLTEKCTDAQVHVFANGEELLSDPTVYDIILLDISLNRKPDSGKPNGMEVAKKIRETSDVIIIFVTALKEYVFEGYDVGAFHYLLKPVDEQKFMEVMDKAISQIKKEKNTPSRSLSEWMAITLRYRSTILFMRKMKREKSFCTRKT